MAVTFNLPSGVEKQLREEFPDFDEAAKEAAMVELYRQAKISHGFLAESLGISRYEVDAILKLHNVTEDLMTPEEFEQEVAGMRKLLGQ